MKLSLKATGGSKEICVIISHHKRKEKGRDKMGKMGGKNLIKSNTILFLKHKLLHSSSKEQLNRLGQSRCI